ncbi:MAG: tyrosine-type recombinase/integrase [Burkholderiales bacterium]|nr:tyrosine-type recombinase/integrase [Burkholderiales bacterium]
MSTNLDLFTVLPSPARDPQRWHSDPLLAAAIWLRTERHQGAPYSEATVQKHLSIVRRYLAALHNQSVPLERAQPSHLAHFLNTLEHLQRDGTLTLTRHRYLRTLEGLHAELIRCGLRTDNPARALLHHFPPPRTRPLPESLTPTEEHRLIESLTRVLSIPDLAWRQLRDAAIVATAVGAGLQPRELVALAIEDVLLNEAPPYLCVASFGRRPERVAPISPSVRPILAAWLDARMQFPASATGPLFCATRAGSDLTVRSIHRACEGWIDRAQVSRTHKGARVLRGAFATRQLRAGKPTTVLRDWMGLAQETSAAAYGRAIVNPGGVEVA